MATDNLITSNLFYLLHNIHQHVPKQKNCIKRVLEICGNFTTYFRLNDIDIEITIATVHPILLNPFLWIPTHVIGQNNFDLWQKTLKQWEFSNIRLGYSHLGRHIEYLKLLKGDNYTPPQISLYTPQILIIGREKNYIRYVGVTPLGCRTNSGGVEIQRSDTNFQEQCWQTELY